MICADCDWFALEPESAWHGACLAFPIRDVRLSGVGEPFNAYERVMACQRACNGFVGKGRLWRRKPVRMMRGREAS